MRGSFIMAHTENTTQNRKNKHLSPFERGEIAALNKAGHTNREIGRRLGRVHGTIANELERGTTTQLETGRNPYTAYLDRKSTRLNSSHVATSYAVFCLKKKKI